MFGRSMFVKPVIMSSGKGSQGNYKTRFRYLPGGKRRFAFGLKSRILNVIKPEFKHYTSYQTNKTIPLIPSSSSTWALVPYVQQGTGANQRIGNRINLSSFHMKFTIYSTLTGSNSETVRAALILDKLPDPNTASLDPSDVWDYSSSAVYTDAYLKLNNIARYVILKDTGAVTLGTYAGLMPQMSFSWHVRLNHQSYFGANTGGATDVDKNNIWFTYWCDGTEVEQPVIYFTWRLRYTDA